MEITFAPRGILQIDDAKLIYRNFSGEGSKYNRPGDRNFSIIIPNQELADQLIDEGWNVKIKPPRDDDDQPFIFLPVKVKFNGRGPNVYLESGPNQILLDEESIAILDNVDIVCADLDIRPYDWKLDDGSSGRAAYLHSMRVVQEVDRFSRRLAEEEYPED